MFKNAAAQKFKFRKSLLKVTSILAISGFAFIGVSAAQVQTIKAYKAQGSSSATLEIGEVRQDAGGRAASMSIVAPSYADCSKMFEGRGMWDWICEKVAKDASGPQTFSGSFYDLKGPQVIGGQLRSPDGGFMFDTEVLLNSDKQVIGVTTVHPRTNERASMVFRDTVGDVQSITEGSEAVSATLSGNAITSKLSLGAVNYDGNRTAQMTFKYIDKSQDCGNDVKTGEGWFRLCEVAFKDRDQILEGTLEPFGDASNTYLGVMTSTTSGTTYNVLVSQAREGYALVTVKRSDDPITSMSNVETLIYDSSGTKNIDISTGEVIDLSANTWRVAHEDIPNMGAEIELEFQKIDSTLSGFTGQMTAYFPPETDEYCPNTSAMLKICESLDKDGPLAFMFGVDKDNLVTGMRYSGVVSVRPGSGISWDAFSMDVFQGNAIADWGDEDPSTVYLRIVTLGQSPGVEAVAWLKLEPLGRSIHEIDSERKIAALEPNLSVPPTPAPQGKTNAAGYEMDAATTKVCGADLDAVYNRAVSSESRSKGMTDEQWKNMINNTYLNAQLEISKYTDAKQFDLKSYCINQVGIMQSWIDGTKYVEINQSKNPVSTTEPKTTGNAKCDEMARALAILKASDGRRADGSVIADWAQQVRFVEYFLRSLPPDVKGDGKSCEKGLEVIATSIDKLGLGQTAGPAPVKNTERDKPNGGTYCEALSTTYSQIGSTQEQNRAREVLLNDTRFGTWKLPTSELGCEAAGSLFAQNRIKGF